MAQEGEGERGLAPDACAARSNRAPQRPHVGRAQIGQFAALQISPQQFDGIEIRRVGGEPLGVQPGLLRREEARHSYARRGHPR